MNDYAAGVRRYRASGSSAPTMGPVDPSGYRQRDLKLNARRNAVLARLQAGQQGRTIGVTPMPNVQAGQAF